MRIIRHKKGQCKEALKREAMEVKSAVGRKWWVSFNRRFDQSGGVWKGNEVGGGYVISLPVIARQCPIKAAATGWLIFHGRTCPWKCTIVLSGRKRGETLDLHCRPKLENRRKWMQIYQWCGGSQLFTDNKKKMLVLLNYWALCNDTYAGSFSSLFKPLFST